MTFPVRFMTQSSSGSKPLEVLRSGPESKATGEAPASEASVSVAAPVASRPSEADAVGADTTADQAADGRREIGGPKGPEPTRFGDWERKGRCVDF